MGVETLRRTLARFPRAETAFRPLAVHVEGCWRGAERAGPEAGAGLLVQLVYSRDDPCRPGRSATFVAAHHDRTGSMSYEVLDGRTVLTLEHCRAGLATPPGIWWVDAPGRRPRPTRATLLWHAVAPVVADIDSVSAAALVAEHLGAVLHATVGPAPGSALPSGPGAPPAGDRPLDAEIGELERLLREVEALDTRLVGSPAEDVAGSSPAAAENRSLVVARARIAVGTATALRTELHGVRARVHRALSIARAAQQDAGRAARRDTAPPPPERP